MSPAPPEFPLSDSTASLRDGKTEVLVRAAKNGQEAAWTAVFQRYERMLNGYARTMAARYRQSIDPLEVVGATFAHAWREIERFEYAGEGSFRRWLCTLTRNRYLSELKAAAGREQPADSGVLENTADEKGAASDRARVQQEALYAAMGELEEEDREILLMHYHEGLNLSQIAEILECSHETAERRRQAALERLRRKLGEGPGGSESGSHG